MQLTNTHKIMRNLIFILFLSFYSLSFAQTVFDKDIYDKYVNEIESIDPNNTNFDDFKFLEAELKDKRIILLGEVGHGDGAAFLAKTRLIKFLTSEMDFKTIAFEGGGFFEMYYSNLQEKNKEEFIKDIYNSWFTIWSYSKQTQELIHYLEESKSQVAYFGIESNPGNNHWVMFPSMVLELFGENAFKDIDRERFQENFFNFYYYFIEHPDASEPNMEEYKAQLKILKENIQDINNEHSSAFVQAVFNLEGLVRQTILQFGTYEEQNEGISLRDSIMAENIKWWLEQNPDEKLIVWAASFHIAYNLNQTIYAEGDDFYDVMKPIGHRLKKEYGDEVYNVAFASSEGENAWAWIPEPTALELEKDSWEIELSEQIPFDYAYINFNGIKTHKKYQDYSFNSSLLGYKKRPGNWLNIFDSVFYIRKMTRSDLIEQTSNSK